ncbi:MAG: hypothetical protein OJF47_003081 [Nitrospira sp.]|jgi:hypothetical protein|nr:MAG: hypothetical protein OJF47_003081 [Nitrospira sp.]
MKVICSWCQGEGRPALVREKAPFADARETHGICPFHLLQMGAGRDPLVPCRNDSSVPRRETVLIRRMWEAVAVGYE